MTAHSFPELAQEVADIIRDRENLKWQVVKLTDEKAVAERELETHKKALIILATENDLTNDYLKLILFKAKEALQNEKKL